VEQAIKMERVEVLQLLIPLQLDMPSMGLVVVVVAMALLVLGA
jgi:hypothetical protein